MIYELPPPFRYTCTDAHYRLETTANVVIDQIIALDPATGSVDIWASGFAGRPLDLIAGPDGDVFVTDFEQGTVWRFFPSDRKRVTFSPSMK